MFCVLEKILLRVLLSPSNFSKMKICFTFAVLFAALTLLPATEGNKCHGGWQSFESFCYLAKSTAMTWHQAQQYCRRMGGDLVKITNQRENDFVLALARKKAPSMKQIWIGLMWTSNAFYWSDYSVPVYKNWAPNEPNGKAREPCSNMWTGHTSLLPHRASGYWNDLPCNVINALRCGLVCKALH